MHQYRELKNSNHNYLMVTVSGNDRPGIAAEFTEILSEHNVEIMDIEQASPQNLLGLYLLLDLRKSSHGKDSVIKELLYVANQLNLNIQFKIYNKRDIKIENDKRLFILTLFGDTRSLAILTRILGDENVNIELISTLRSFGKRTIEMTINFLNRENIGTVKKRLLFKSRELEFDLAIQKMESYRKNKRLILFDMDNTLIDMEIIDEIAKMAGVYQEVSRITEKAMRGELDFEESLRQRVAFIKDVSVSDLKKIRTNIRLSKGVKNLMSALRYLGYKIGIISGGFDFFANHLKEKLKLDYAFSHKLDLKNNKFTGKIIGNVIDAAEKARIVNNLSKMEQISLDQVVAIGDGANDALMLGQAGLGIAYNSRKPLTKAANMSIGKERLTNILILLGITESDLLNSH